MRVFPSRFKSFLNLVLAMMITVSILYRPGFDDDELASDTLPKVLLISEMVIDRDVLSQAVDEKVLAILYDAQSSSLDDILLRLRNTLKGRKASSIGIVAHDFGSAKFFLTSTHTISLTSTMYSKAQISFWKELGGMIAEGGRIDLFACGLASNFEGKMLLSRIADIANVDVAASVDDTGNPNAGGDWILETADIDLAGEYFVEEELSRFSSLLFSEVKKLSATPGAEDNYFGRSVSISGDVAIVGAYGDDYSRGSACLFERNEGGINNWGQVKKITAADSADFDYFGASVCISGDAAIVGAYGDDENGSNSGSAYVFFRNQGGENRWGQVAKLTPSDAKATQYFGWSVAISGNYALVGAKEEDAGSLFNKGSAYLFARNHGGKNNWGQVKKFTAHSDFSFDDYFGDAVSISGDTAIVGSARDRDFGYDEGAAYIFNRNHGGENNWGEVTKLRLDEGDRYDAFGGSVSISGNTAIVGAWGDDADGSDSGTAYIYCQDQDNNWRQVKRLIAPDADEEDRFGGSVSVSGDIAIVGARLDDDKGSNSGSVYVFSRNHGGTNNWGFVKKLKASDGAAGEGFGRFVSISGNRAIIGMDYDDDVGFFSGSAYIFDNVDVGYLKVVIKPKVVRKAGAQWKLKSAKQWYNSGQIVSLSVGKARIQFKKIKDWIKPKSRKVRIKENKKAKVIARYEPK